MAWLHTAHEAIDENVYRFIDKMRLNVWHKLMVPGKGIVKTLTFLLPTNFFSYKEPFHIFVSSLLASYLLSACLFIVLAASPSCGGDVAVCIFWHNQPNLPTSFYILLLASISVFTVLSTVFHSINSPDNSLLSHSVLQVLLLPYQSFQLYISFWKSKFFVKT